MTNSTRGYVEGTHRRPSASAAVAAAGSQGHHHSGPWSSLAGPLGSLARQESQYHEGEGGTGIIVGQTRLDSSVDHRTYAAFVPCSKNVHVDSTVDPQDYSDVGDASVHLLLRYPLQWNFHDYEYSLPKRVLN